MTASNRPILIVGAGPTGLTLAIELARRNVPFHLIDHAPEPNAKSAAIFIKSRSLEILSDLGVVERFLARGELVEGVNNFLGSQQVANYRFAGLDSPFPNILSIPENITVELLTEELIALGGSIERGVEFTGLEDLETFCRVMLRGQDRGEYELDVSWVVGTDGYHSAVREAIGDQFDGRDYPQLWGVVDTELEGWTHSRRLVAGQLEPPNVIPFPLGKRRWRVYFRPDRADASALSAAEARLAVISPGVKLVNSEDPQFFQSHSRLARQFRKGRVFLAGDAAHASNPIEGHGMNAGIQDAYNLGWKLAAMAGGMAGDELIESYELERRVVDQTIVNSGEEAYGRMAPDADAARRSLIEFLSTKEGQDFAALSESEIAFAYDRSPVAVEENAAISALPPATAMGARVGDAQGLRYGADHFSLHALIAGTSTHVFHILGKASEHDLERGSELLHALRACADPDRITTHLVAMRTPGETHDEPLLLDSDGQLHARLGGEEKMICVIRPDGHLGYRSASPDLQKVLSYLQKIGVAH